MAVQGSDRVLLCSAQTSSFALPLAHVLETMRPLPVQPILGSPPFVRGLAIVRGEPVPVVDLASLMGGGRGSPRRWVIVRAGAPATVLEVDRILGIHTLSDGVLRDLPPLLQNTDTEVISAMGALDAQLLLLLDQSRLLPDGLPEPADNALSGASA